ncbi:hypothetical protein ACH5A3_40395 [Streptomyces echinatus]|uniref:hypothetical protein n=1 Tax=Streptomyces echinatus TaxID=67293 RepID=UPI0037B93160
MAPKGRCRGLLVEAEDLCEMEWVRALDHGLFELAVDAEFLQGRVLAAHRSADPVVAGAAGGVDGLVVDQQVEVRGVRPPAAPVLQPVQQQLQGEVVERADASGDGQPAVAEVDVVEHEGGDLGDPGGVDRCEGEDEPRRRGGGRRDGAVDLFGHEWLQHGVLVLPDLDPAGGVAEGQSVPLGPAEQRAQGDELVVSLVAVQCLDVGEDIVAGHFLQMVVAVRPVQQGRADSVEVEPDRALSSREAAGAAVAQDAGPALGLPADAGCEALQPRGEPAFEGGFAVVFEDPHLLQDRDGVADRQVQGPQRGEDLRVPDDVALDVAGENEGQAAIDGEADVAPPGRGPRRAGGRGTSPRSASGRPGRRRPG